MGILLQGQILFSAHIYGSRDSSAYYEHDSCEYRKVWSPVYERSTHDARVGFVFRWPSYVWPAEGSNEITYQPAWGSISYFCPRTLLLILHCKMSVYWDSLKICCLITFIRTKTELQGTYLDSYLLLTCQEVLCRKGNVFIVSKLVEGQTWSIKLQE